MSYDFLLSVAQTLQALGAEGLMLTERLRASIQSSYLAFPTFQRANLLIIAHMTNNCEDFFTFVRDFPCLIPRTVLSRGLIITFAATRAAWRRKRADRDLW